MVEYWPLNEQVYVCAVSHTPQIGMEIQVAITSKFDLDSTAIRLLILSH